MCVHDQLERVYFPILPLCNYISVKKREDLALNALRESQQTKVTYLMGEVPCLMDEMQLNENLLNADYIKITPKLLNNLKDFSTYISIGISLTQLFFLKRINHYRDSSQPDEVNQLVQILGLIQGVSSGILIIFYAITKVQLVTASSWREYIK